MDGGDRFKICHTTGQRQTFFPHRPALDYAETPAGCFTEGDVVGLKLDLGRGSLTLYRNGQRLGTLFGTLDLWISSGCMSDPFVWCAEVYAPCDQVHIEWGEVLDDEITETERTGNYKKQSADEHDVEFVDGGMGGEGYPSSDEYEDDDWWLKSYGGPVSHCELLI
jgi:hypothetical protein